MGSFDAPKLTFPPTPPTHSSCFQSAPDEPWNWNLYLAPLWALGVFFRHCILFPLRALLLASAFIVFFIAFFGCRLFSRGERRQAWERGCVKFLCQAFVASWTGVVRYHGPRPVPRGTGRVWVSNHTSMIDYIILTACSPFAVIMQLHNGWVGFLQTQVLSCLGCLWFNRTEVTDRAVVAARMRAHVASPAATPLLIFPEGTCVNNRYCVMFKRGAFDVGAVVCPVAIRYDRVFVDAFWNSKRQSFTSHLAKLMRSWAVVCDVWFLEPQARRPGEDASAFAERVQKMIATRAGLTIAPWDGYLKYYNLGAKVRVAWWMGWVGGEERGKEVGVVSFSFPHHSHPPFPHTLSHSAPRPHRKEARPVWRKGAQHAAPEQGGGGKGGRRCGVARRRRLHPGRRQGGRRQRRHDAVAARAQLSVGKKGWVVGWGREGGGWFSFFLSFVSTFSRASNSFLSFDSTRLRLWLMGCV